MIVLLQIDSLFESFMENYPTIVTLMRNHHITAIQFFIIPNINTQIRNNLTKFVKFIRTHKQFALQLIRLAYNTPPQYLSNLEKKCAVHAAIDVLNSEDTPIADLFLDLEHEDIPQQINEVQSEAQRLFEGEESTDAPPQQQAERPVQLQKGELLCASLEVFKAPDPNETCLGHLQKLYSFLVRSNPNAVLEHFQTHPQQRDLLLNSLRHSTASNILSQMLTCQDKTKQYAFESLKKSMLTHALQSLLGHIEDDFYFEGILTLFEEVLNTTKQSYYEYFQDFKRIANILVSKEVMVRFRELLNPTRPSAFKNGSRYLQFLFGRINSENEDNSYYSRGGQSEPTMDFEVQQFYDDLPQLIEMVGSIDSLSSMAKIAYLSFLDALLVAFRANNRTYSILHPSFLTLLTTLDNEKSTGVYKAKLHSLTSSLLSKSTQSQVKQFLSVNPDLYKHNFSAIRNANYNTNTIYNRNQAVAFDVSLLNQMNKKNEDMMELVCESIHKDFKRMIKKYNTKIASFQNNNNPLFDSDIIDGKLQLPSNFSFNIGNKNIPTLSLPTTNRNKVEGKEDRPQNQRQSGSSDQEGQKMQIMQLSEQERMQMPQLKPDNFDYDKESPIKKRSSPVVEKQVKIEKVGLNAVQKAGQINFYAKHLALYS